MTPDPFEEFARECMKAAATFVLVVLLIWLTVFIGRDLLPIILK